MARYLLKYNAPYFFGDGTLSAISYRFIVSVLLNKPYLKRRLEKAAFCSLFFVIFAASPCFATPPPVITSQPTNQTVQLLDNATFQVGVYSATKVTYQWFMNGTNAIPNSNTNIYTISNVQMTNQGTYSVTVKNAGGSVNSSNATLTVLVPVPPGITTQPQSTGGLGGAGSSATFSVVASGTTPLKYQWYYNGKAMGAGSTSSNLTVTPIGPAQVGNYFVVITNNYGSVTSAIVTLTPYFAPTIGGGASQPQNTTVLLGGTASFTVVTNAGSGPISYQWYFNGTNGISGGTNATLTLVNVQTNQAGSYTVVVTNAWGAVTSAPAATLTVNVPATITSQPQPLALVAGQNASFAVGATGTPNLSYQWYFNGTQLSRCAEPAPNELHHQRGHE